VHNDVDDDDELFSDGNSSRLAVLQQYFVILDADLFIVVPCVYLKNVWS